MLVKMIQRLTGSRILSHREEGASLLQYVGMIGVAVLLTTTTWWAVSGSPDILKSVGDALQHVSACFQPNQGADCAIAPPGTVAQVSEGDQERNRPGSDGSGQPANQSKGGEEGPSGGEEELGDSGFDPFGFLRKVGQTIVDLGSKVGEAIVDAANPIGEAARSVWDWINANKDLVILGLFTIGAAVTVILILTGTIALAPIVAMFVIGLAVGAVTQGWIQLLSGQSLNWLSILTSGLIVGFSTAFTFLLMGALTAAFGVSIPAITLLSMKIAFNVAISLVENAALNLIDTDPNTGLSTNAGTVVIAAIISTFVVEKYMTRQVVSHGFRELGVAGERGPLSRIVSRQVETIRLGIKNLIKNTIKLFRIGELH